MWEDPIVEEIHRIRQEILAEHDHDLDALFRDIRERMDRGEFSDFQIVRLPPRSAQPQPPARRTGT